MRRKQPKIQFISTVPGLADIPELRPQPANKFTPDWWKKMPMKRMKYTIDSTEQGNAKSCPSFFDWFSSGYVIPMWADTILSYDEITKVWQWKTADGFDWTQHYNEQFMDHVDYEHLGDKGKFIFKAETPWRIITPKGWSCYQMPLFYHFENEFTVMPGIVDTDVLHRISQQVIITSGKKEIFIPRGTPFVQYIPFKRSKIKLDVHEATPEDYKILRANQLDLNTSFMTQRRYEKLQKKARKECPVNHA